MLAAALSPPPAAVAPPTAGSPQAPEVSELVVEARRATAVSGVVIERCPIPSDKDAYSTRAIRTVANRQYDAPAQPHGRTEESPGTREFVLRNIAAFRKGTADYAHMSSNLAWLTRNDIDLERRWIICRGPLKDIKFLHVSEDGYDDFEVEFANSVIEWEVKPLNARQVTDHWAARFYYPEPVTKQFDEFLKSMERGSPAYDRLSTGYAAILQAQWPALKRAFRKWYGSHAVVFTRHEDDGSYTYKVYYRYHVVFWTVTPPDEDGRLTGLTYTEAS